MNKLSVAATMAVLGLSAGVAPAVVAPLFAAPVRAVSWSGSGRRRKPHNRGRCTRATPAGVVRSRARKTRRYRREFDRAARRTCGMLARVIVSQARMSAFASLCIGPGDVLSPPEAPRAGGGA